MSGKNVYDSEKNRTRKWEVSPWHERCSSSLLSTSILLVFFLSWSFSFSLSFYLFLFQSDGNPGHWLEVVWWWSMWWFLNGERSLVFLKEGELQLPVGINYSSSMMQGGKEERKKLSRERERERSRKERKREEKRRNSVCSFTFIPHIIIYTASSCSVQWEDLWERKPDSVTIHWTLTLSLDTTSWFSHHTRLFSLQLLFLILISWKSLPSIFFSSSFFNFFLHHNEEEFHHRSLNRSSFNHHSTFYQLFIKSNNWKFKWKKVIRSAKE